MPAQRRFSIRVRRAVAVPIERNVVDRRFGRNAAVAALAPVGAKVNGVR